MINMKNAASIGIIGGADGPTAIFVAGKELNWLVAGGIALAAVAVVILCVLIYKRHKKNK